MAIVFQRYSLMRLMGLAVEHDKAPQKLKCSFFLHLCIHISIWVEVRLLQFVFSLSFGAGSRIQAFRSRFRWASMLALGISRSQACVGAFRSQFGSPKQHNLD